MKKDRAVKLVDACNFANNFPDPDELYDAFSQKTAAKIREKLRPATMNGFKQLLAGVDRDHLITNGIYRETSAKTTASSIRDYTSWAAIIALALGLQSRADYVQCVLDPDAYGVSDDHGPSDYAIGLHKAAWEKALNLYGGTIPGSTADECFGLLLKDVHTAIKQINAKGAEDSSSDFDFSWADLTAALQVYAILHHEHNQESGLARSNVCSLPGIQHDVAVAIRTLIDNANASGNEIEMPANDDIISGVVGAVEWLLAQEEKVETKASDDKPKGPSYTVPKALSTAVNAVLDTAGLPRFDVIIKELDEAKSVSVQLFDEVKTLQMKMATMTTSAHAKPVTVAATGELPDGKTTWIPAIKALEHKGLKPSSKYKGLFDFDVPFFEWDGDHRDVPDFDADYRWRWDILAKLMWGLAFNKKPWIWGHTGTGKTTLVEQVCAILNWPFMRINFDSEITRMDLVGRDTLKTDEHGNTSSHFQDGILPQAMMGPYVICNDELDFVRSDIAYVYQRSLEDKGLLLTEDGGRLVQPHEMSRMVATANTQGQGDEFGLYQGARVQSQAFLDRFQCWIEVPYLDEKDERELITAKVPSLNKDMVRKITKYTVEHREAFKQAAILKPISPRGVVSMSEAIAFFTSLHSGEDKEGVRMALETTVLGSVTHADAAKINELIDRTFN